MIFIWLWIYQCFQKDKLPEWDERLLLSCCLSRVPGTESFTIKRAVRRIMNKETWPHQVRNVKTCRGRLNHISLSNFQDDYHFCPKNIGGIISVKKITITMFLGYISWNEKECACLPRKKGLYMEVIYPLWVCLV